jgi:phosphomannomutase/phosphoglucomutase
MTKCFNKSFAKEKKMFRLFGTDGVRGITNKEMNSYLVLEIGLAFGTWLKRAKKRGKVLVGTDTRTSNELLKCAFCSGLLSTGCEAIDLGILPSPALQYSVKYLEADGGAIITASHNPPPFNGIKLIEPSGMEMVGKDLVQIEDIYFNKRFCLAKWNGVGKLSKWEGGIRIYIDAIKSKVDEEAIKKENLKVVVDCGNGAGALCLPYLLCELGCEVISLNAQPDGLFPCHEPEPLRENLKELINQVKSLKGSAIGVAHDGDADRIIFVTEDGDYLFGDKSLAIIAAQEVKRKPGSLFVTPVSSSSCVEEVVKKNGGKVLYTPIGAPIVAHQMVKHQAIFGGEENGGLIFPEHQYCRDGAMGIAKMLELMAKSNKSLKELAEEIPTYSLSKTKTYCPQEKKRKVMERFISTIKRKGIPIQTIDGAKVRLKEGWVLVRPSGTEPIFRIFTEAKNSKDSKRLAEEYKNKVEEIIARFKQKEDN